MTDSEKLRALADAIDNKYIKSDGKEVQQDLRRIADKLEANHIPYLKDIVTRKELHQMTATHSKYTNEWGTFYDENKKDSFIQGALWMRNIIQQKMNEGRKP